MSLKTKDAAILSVVVGAGVTVGGLAAYQASRLVEAGFHKVKEKLAKKKEEKEGNADHE